MADNIITTTIENLEMQSAQAQGMYTAGMVDASVAAGERAIAAATVYAGMQIALALLRTAS
jgi:hypothetical protein